MLRFHHRDHCPKCWAWWHVAGWHYRRRSERRALSTRIEVRIGGELIIGPMTLEQLAIVGRMGGYGDLLQTGLCRPGTRVEFIISPPKQ